MSRTRDARHVLLAALLSVLLACGSLVGGGVQVASGETAGGGEKDVVVVSLGDSYSSGEGVEPFYGQNDDNKINDQDWLAHRSTKSWPGKLRVNGGTVLLSDNKADPADPVSDQSSAAWYFLASSGAVTADIVEGEQVKEVGIDPLTKRHTVASGPYVNYEERTIDRQLDGLESAAAANGGSVDYVTMTIGGNDVGFVDVVTSCITSNQLFDFRGVENRLDQAEEDFNSTVRADMRETYVQVSAAAGADAHVIVAGYPTLLDTTEGHFYFFHQNESLMINNKVEWFNAQIELLVDEVNADNDGSRAQVVFASVADEFRGHEAYSDSPYLNEVMLFAQAEDLRDTVVSAYSIHPNELGTDAYARAVQRVIDQIEGGQAQAPAPTDQTAPSQPQTTPATTTPVEKDVALVLDVSGSMDGQPLEETKNATGQFVDVALENGAECALVTYDNEARTLSGFSSDGATLRSEALGLDSGGGWYWCDHRCLWWPDWCWYRRTHWSRRWFDY